jgi:hypothetical protein
MTTRRQIPLRLRVQVEAPAVLATVSGEEDVDLLAILPPIVAFAFVYDEVLTRQCPCLGLSIHGAYVGAWRIRRLQTEIGGAHEFTQVWPPGG